jgi:hypothetical protein
MLSQTKRNFYASRYEICFNGMHPAVLDSKVGDTDVLGDTPQLLL